MAMDLPVVVGMKKHTVFRPVAAAVRSPHNMMVVPSGQRGDLLTTHDTDTVLSFPEMKQLPTAPQVGFHLHTESVLEVFLPVRVVRVDIRFQLGIALDRHLGRFEQVVGLAFSLCSHDVPLEDPMPVTHRAEGLPLDPARALVGVSPFRPTPERFEDRRVDFVKSPCARTMPVRVSPTPDDRVKAQDQMASRRLLVRLDEGSNCLQERFHVFLGGLGQICTYTKIILYLSPKFLSTFST
jgi:hypothetical protein